MGKQRAEAASDVREERKAAAHMVSAMGKRRQMGPLFTLCPDSCREWFLIGILTD